MAGNVENVDRLLDAIELVKLNRRRDAYYLLREIIRDDNDFEDAWLWMSITVDNLDQSAICLDNVLRVNPDNVQAAGALYRLRKTELALEQQRRRLSMIRDSALIVMWLLIVGALFAVLFTYSTRLLPPAG